MNFTNQIKIDVSTCLTKLIWTIGSPFKGQNIGEGKVLIAIEK